MTVVYATATKTARMNAIVTALGASGKLELGTASMASVLATIALGNPAGTVSTDTLTFSGFPRSDTSADATGKATAARLRDGSNNDILTMSCGLTSSAAPNWAGSTAYTLGQYRTNGANIYKCTTAGTSASSGGPTGTGTSISDGTATWDWYCVANADVKLDSIEITATQTVTINSATLQHAA
jgi:hypothetical protein